MSVLGGIDQVETVLYERRCSSQLHMRGHMIDS